MTHVQMARAWFGAAAFGAALAGATAPAAGQPCSFDCNGDTLGLRAPGQLRVRVQRGTVSGNVLVWAPVPDSLATCASIRAVKPPFTLPAFSPQLGGAYSDRVDRQLKFSADAAGVVGDLTQKSVVLTWNNLDTQAGPISGGVAGSINVSSAGGLFQMAPGTGNAIQINSGIPPYLFPASNVRSLAAWRSPDARPSRVWAALTGNTGTLLVRADVGPGGTFSWSAVLDPRDPGGPLQSRYSPVAVAASPSNPDVVLLATVNDGVHRSVDGGATWTRVPSFSGGVEQVSYLGYIGGSLYACLVGTGLYRSTDDGVSWTLVALTTPAQTDAGAYCPTNPGSRTPVVRAMAADPNNPSQIYAGLQAWGVYRSPDGGTTWVRGNDGLVLCPSAEDIDGRPVDVTALLVDRAATNVLLAGTTGRGMFRSTDYGQTWAELGGLDPTATLTALLQDPSDPATITACVDNVGLLRSVDGAVSWSAFGTGLTNNDLVRMVEDPTVPGGVLVGSEGAGIYRPGTEVPLSRTIRSTGTDPDKLSLQLGLTIRFNEGPVAPGDSLFVIRAQTYQGYAVWRGRTPDPASMQMIGLYDRTNVEACFADPCDAEFPSRIQGCFADKRAACFTFFGADSVTFFDRDVYNGFTYYYAVSTTDYGYTGNIFPTGLAREMLFSPRGPNETAPEAVPFLDCGPGGSVNTNQTEFQVNVETSSSLASVYVVPNPLRRRGGWDIGEAATVRFVNVTPGSKCEIFTVSGDLVAELTNAVTDGVERGNIEWNTRNADGRDVASGVYIFRITNRAGEEEIGRFTIIR